MIVPYQVDVPMQRYPVANWVHMGATIVISLVLLPAVWAWESENRMMAMLSMDLEKPAGVLQYFLLQQHHFNVTQLLGSLFIHAGFLHLAGNMLFLWVFGNAVDAKLGHWRFLALYALAGMFEGLLTVLLGDGRPTLGASGAIMGVVGMYVMLYPTNNISMFYWIAFVWTGVKEISGYWIVAFYVAFDIWGLITASNGGVAYLAHVAGFAFGLVAGAILLWTRQTVPTHLEKSLLQCLGIMPETPAEKILHTGVTEPVKTTRIIHLAPPSTKRAPPIELD